MGTLEDIRENIAKFLYDITYRAKYSKPSALRDGWITLTEEQQEYFRVKADKVIDLTNWGIKFLSDLKWASANGYVKLAEDQTLPEGVGECMDCSDSDKMLRGGWRKVEVKDES